MPADMTPHAHAVPAGREPERVAVRVGEDRTLLIDCAALLSDGERIASCVAAMAQPPGLRVTGAPRVRPGSLIEMSVRAPAAAEVKTWRDYSLSARVRTTRGQVLSAIVTVRVHRE